MSSRFPTSTRPSFGGFSLGGAPPRDLIVLLGVLLVTFSLRFFGPTRIVPALLELTPGVWQRGFVWQLITYPFVGNGGPGIWFLLELFFLGMFGRDVFNGARAAPLLARAGERRARWPMVGVLVRSPATSSRVDRPSPPPFVLLQGQHVLFAIVIAAFATLYRDATILLFFVLPVRARWFLAIEVLFAFMAFLPPTTSPASWASARRSAGPVLLAPPGDAAAQAGAGVSAADRAAVDSVEARADEEEARPPRHPRQGKPGASGPSGPGRGDPWAH